MMGSYAPYASCSHLYCAQLTFRPAANIQAGSGSHHGKIATNIQVMWKVRYTHKDQVHTQSIRCTHKHQVQNSSHHGKIAETVNRPSGAHTSIRWQASGLKCTQASGAHTSIRCKIAAITVKSLSRWTGHQVHY
jgi:hypothetical protein